MNPGQKMKAERLARRFSTGDGVQLPDGRRGVIRAFGNTTPDRGIACSVAVEGEEAWAQAHEADLTSVPELNTGKYGGRREVARPVDGAVAMAIAIDEPASPPREDRSATR